MTIFQKMRLLCLGLFAGLALQACNSAPLPPLATASIQSDTDSYVVLGVDPDLAQVYLHSGGIRNAKFDAEQFYEPPYYGPPQDGFILIKLAPGKALAMDGVQIMTSRTNSFGPAFWTNLALTFTPQPGKVVYLQSVSLHHQSYLPEVPDPYRFLPLATNPEYGQVLPSYHSDLEGARAFMKKHYPGLADRLEQGQFQFLPMR